MIARVTLLGIFMAASPLPAAAEEPKAEQTASERAAPTESAAQSDNASAQTASAASTDASADVVEEGESKPITEADIDRFLKLQGYTPVERRGVMYYCRSEAPMGTRVKKSVCITGEEAVELRNNAKEMMRQKDQRTWVEGM